MPQSCELDYQRLRRRDAVLAFSAILIFSALSTTIRFLRFYPELQHSTPTESPEWMVVHQRIMDRQQAILEAIEDVKNRLPPQAKKLGSER